MQKSVRQTKKILICHYKLCKIDYFYKLKIAPPRSLTTMGGCHLCANIGLKQQ